VNTIYELEEEYLNSKQWNQLEKGTPGNNPDNLSDKECAKQPPQLLL
jgi:hypothetical protein